VTSAPIKITIFDHSREEHCSGQCGPDRLQDEIAFVTEHLKRSFGDQVAVEYIDLAESPQHEAVMEKIRAHNLPLPVVAINGIFKLSGSIEFRAVKEAIEAQMEVGCG
jgi:disulfide oxidoreductase YuzD